MLFFANLLLLTHSESTQWQIQQLKVMKWIIISLYFLFATELEWGSSEVTVPRTPDFKSEAP